ncbi:hypothetical protein [uncultured Adlercreutzia sp.]|nr:hypothetical protein [uncultured Adlercreutzia sp.]MCI9262845.1 hypothetical protein [Eggerthellaceae bacterium]
MAKQRAFSIVPREDWPNAACFPSRHARGGQMRYVFHRRIVNRHFLANHPALSVISVANRGPVSTNCAAT